MVRKKSRKERQIEEDLKTSRKLTDFFKPGKMKIVLEEIEPNDPDKIVLEEAEEKNK